jgi:hypothetical protein
MTQCFLCGPHHVPTATGMHATIEELLEAMFSAGSVPMLYHEDQQDMPVSLECLESAVSSWETVTPGRGMGGRGMGGRAARIVESSCVVMLVS